MLNFLNSNIFNIFFIILLHCLIHQTYSISGTETYSFDPSAQSVDINNICPCDINVGVCDTGCICDQDCFDLMLYNEASFNFLKAADISSYTDENLDSKLDYCDEYQESLDDLYNPLILAFKILKRGFCLVKTSERNDNDVGDQRNYEEIINNNQEEEQGTTNNYNDAIPDNNIGNFVGRSNFQAFNLFVPIALPNGLCLFHSHQIRKNINYEVTCSYNRANSGSIVSDFLNGVNHNNKIIVNDYLYNSVTDEEGIGNRIIKKMEIIYYNKDENNNYYDINCYYKESDGDEDFCDLTVEIKFLNSRNDFIKSGNYGYIKGKPMVITNDEDRLYPNGALFPLQSNSYSIIENTLYFDNYMDNKITFEDLIIYGYNNNYNNDIRTLFNSIYEDKLTAQYGNGAKRINLNYYNNDNNNYFIILGKYKDSGAVNNTQIKIVEYVEANKISITQQVSNYFYFIVKFIKLETEKKWWYAPGPVIARVPKNIMYPFKIGTSNYKKNNN